MTALEEGEVIQLVREVTTLVEREVTACEEGEITALVKQVTAVFKKKGEKKRQVTALGEGECMVGGSVLMAMA